MKRINGTPTRLLRVKLLPGCLALALVVGSNVLSPEYANAQASLANASRSNEPFVAAAHTAGLPGPERQALIERMQSAARTPPPVPANSIAVNNCNDSGAGSYREAVGVAVSGDTIDLTNTGCSKITLTTGDILTFANDLTLQGPGLLALSIDGNSLYRPMEHLGTGTLTINDLMIAHGTKYLSASATGNASGGCVHSEGTVALDHAWVKYCDAGSAGTTGVKGGAIYGKAGVYLGNSLVTGSTVHSSGSFAYGGGVYSAGTLFVVNSSISGNTAHSTVTWGQGGGAEAGSSGGTAGGPTLIKYSTVQSNVAIGGSAGEGLGGGLYTTGNAYIDNSTIAGNQADFAGGLELQKGANVTAPFSINSSTISGNNSTGRVGGVYVGLNPTQINNSTIAFNTAHTSNKYGAGLLADNNVVDLQSTIISGNTTDLGTGPLVDDVGGSGSLTGANNLIFASALTTPPGTITFTDPMLASLSSNGGPTSTHALSPLSPAINTGNNNAGFSYDQRGTGYPRVIGAGPDIGAFELDLSDVIFANGFD